MIERSRFVLFSNGKRNAVATAAINARITLTGKAATKMAIPAIAGPSQESPGETGVHWLLDIKRARNIPARVPTRSTTTKTMIEKTI